MDPKTYRPPPERPSETPTEPRKRFRIDRIEERIAPGGHYNPQSKWVGGGNNDSSASGSLASVF